MRGGVTICAAVLLLGATTSAQSGPHPLTDLDLDRVTAGQNQSPVGPGANQESGVVVANNSSATLVDSAEVENSATGPASGKGLNIITAAESDVATGLNVSDSQTVASPLVKTTQLNNVLQSGAPVGSIQSITAGAYVKDISQITSHHTDSSSSFSHDLTSSASSSFHFQSIISQANVPGFNPFNSVLTLPNLQLPSFTFPKVGLTDFGPGFTGDEPFEFGFKINVDIGPTTFQLGGINLGQLDLTQDNLVLKNLQIESPSATFKAGASGKGCLFTCGTFDVSFDKTVGVSIPAFPDIPLGPNPFKDLKVQAGGGVAGVGTGTLDASLGTIGASVNFTFTWPDSLQHIDLKIPDFTLDLPIVGQKTIPGPDFGSINLKIQPVSFSFSIIPSTSFGGFHVSSQNAAYCVSVEGSCPQVSATFIDNSSDLTQDEHSVSNISSSSGDQCKVAEHQTLFPPTVGDTEGQFLVVGESNLSNQSNSSLKMSGTAQQGFHALNLLNLTSTLMATGVNVSMTPAGTGFALAQANNVLQSH